MPISYSYEITEIFSFNFINIAALFFKTRHLPTKSTFNDINLTKSKSKYF